MAAGLIEAIRFPPIRIALFICSGCLIILLLTIMGLWWPAHRQHDAVQLSIDEKRRQLVLLLQADDIGRAYRSALQVVPRLESRLTLDMSQAEFVNILGRLSSRHGARLLAQSFDERKVQQDQPIIALELNLEGPYAAIRGFMLGLSDLPVWCEIEEMRLERARESTGIIRAQLRLIVHRKAAIKSARDNL